MPYYEVEEANELASRRPRKGGGMHGMKSDMGGYGPSLILEIVKGGKDPEKERPMALDEEDIEVREALVDELLMAIENKDKPGIWMAMSAMVDMINSESCY